MVNGVDIQMTAYDFNDPDDKEILDKVIDGYEPFKNTAEGEINLDVKALSIKNCVDNKVGDVDVTEMNIDTPKITNL